MIGLMSMFLHAQSLLQNRMMTLQNAKIDQVQSVSPLIPRRELLGNPERAAVQLSDDGKYVSWLADVEGVSNIWVQSYDDMVKQRDNARPVTNDTARGIYSQSWSYLPNTLIYVQDVDGDENIQLFKLTLSDDAVKVDSLVAVAGAMVKIIKTSHRYPDIFMIGLNDRDPRYHDVYSLNLTSGDMKLVYENNEYASFVMDNDLNIRFAKNIDQNGNNVYWLANQESEGVKLTFTKYLEVPFDDTVTTGIISFSKDNQHTYWKNGTGSHLERRAISDMNGSNIEILFTPTNADLGFVYMHPTEFTPMAAIEYYDKAHVIVLDQKYAKDFEIIYGKAEDAHVANVGIVSTTLDLSKAILVYDYNDRPPAYYMYDFNTKEVSYLFDPYPKLSNYTFANRRPVEILTRDKMFDKGPPCYSSKPIPMYLYVHGGPSLRDHSGYAADVQLLANRGIAVLQCNFRGSIGFGKAFYNAGNGEWSKKMHDDLIDAVNWATQMKIADPKKVAIGGISYGGYAALVGLTFTPDVFACGIDVVGPSNLVTLLESVPEYWAPFLIQLEKMIGASSKTEEGRALLKERSPLYKAEQIKKPLLIAQGANDPRVKINESEQITKALRDHGVPYTYVVFTNEGHGVIRPENRFAISALSEKFLIDCLGVERTPEPMNEETRNLTSAVMDQYDGGASILQTKFSENTSSIINSLEKYDGIDIY